MKNTFKFAFAMATVAVAAQAGAAITLYENEGFSGWAYISQQDRIRNLKRDAFDNRASSAVVAAGQRWEVCEDVRFQGRCFVLRPGQYPTLNAMGLNDRVSSVRLVAADERIANDRYAPMPQVQRDYGRRRNERLYDAPVTSVRAVAGTPGQRCWMERGQVAAQPALSQVNVPGAVIGAVIGGILGHQVGSGSGNKIATAGGAVAGGAIGSQVGRNTNAPPVTQDVQRCDNNPAQAVPAYWDVTYNFRGVEHRVQLATPPGSTIAVNRQGEPRA